MPNTKAKATPVRYLSKMTGLPQRLNTMLQSEGLGGETLSDRLGPERSRKLSWKCIGITTCYLPTLGFESEYGV